MGGIRSEQRGYQLKVDDLGREAWVVQSSSDNHKSSSIGAMMRERLSLYL
jgi:hypothetical protein